MRRFLLTALAGVCVMPQAFAVVVDGRIGRAEWANATRIDDFRLVQPLSREPSELRTHVQVKSTPKGLAIAFRNVQPEAVTATRQRFQRDRAGSVDRVNVYIDFDGDGRSGYNFMVSRGGDIGDTTIANENQFNGDWDGSWSHAVAETRDGWAAEMLIPWHIATMKAVEGDMRRIGLSVDRVVGVSGQRMAWPAVTWSEPQYLSVLGKLDVQSYSQSLLAITPYVVAVQDQVAGRATTDSGADVFWKPSGQFQLSATLNPDFGQVESDELVVNFGAVETFFSDKRPFFTENQSIFDVGFGSPGGMGGGNRLIYTRRVGSQADDGSGAGDVRGAVKLNGSLGDFAYGVFSANEADPAGRDFHALRGTWDHDDFGLGAMLTEVRRPFVDRVARTVAIDPSWAFSETLDIRAVVVGSDVTQGDRAWSDTGAQVLLNHDLGEGWRQQVYALHSGTDLQLNDFGFLDRNSFNYVRYERSRRVTDVSSDSLWSSHEWRYAASSRYNNRGLRLFNTLAVNQFSEARNGSKRFWDVAANLGSLNDDLVLRGNGFLKRPGEIFLIADWFVPKQGDSRWEFEVDGGFRRQGLQGGTRGAWEIEFEPAYSVSDSLRFTMEAGLTHNNDWVLWRGGNLVGNFKATVLSLNTGMEWRISPKQELRIKLESIGLRAETLGAYRVGIDGRAVRSADVIDDFRLQNLGFQVRYRYELAPLSDLYVAYVRGGELFERGEGFDSPFDQLGDAFTLRDSEQLLVKLSYRFTL